MNTNYIYNLLEWRINNISFILGIALLSSVVFAQETIHNSIEIESEQVIPKKSRIKKAIAKIYQRHEKPKGSLDPHFPTMLEYKSPLIKLPKNYRFPDEFRIKDGKLDLNSLTPDVLWDLTGSDLEKLLDYLKQVPVKIRWFDRFGSRKPCKNKSHKHITHWEKTNAAAALALNSIVNGDPALFATLVSSHPSSILPELDGDAVAYIDTVLATKIINALLWNLERINSSDISVSIATLVETYLKYWAGSNLTHIEEHLALLIEGLKKDLYVEDQLKEQVAGIAFGSILAGAIKRANAIKEKDGKRLMIVNAACNIVWAATTFIGVAPIAGNVIAVTAGGLSMASVLTAAVYNELGMPRDYLPTMKEQQGKIEIDVLAIAQKKDTNAKVSVLMFLRWISACMHANGLND